MRAFVMRKANAAVAVLVSLLCAVSLLGTPAVAKAESASDSAPTAIEITGVDYMETGSFGWEILRLENGAGQTIYMDVLKDGQYLTRNISYTVPASDVDAEDAEVAYAGSGFQLAHIVALQMKQENGEPAAVKDLLGAPGEDPNYTIVVHDAPVQGKTLFEGAIYPIYAKLVKGGDASYQLLGIRTVDARENAPSPSELSKNAGVGATCYENLDADNVDERVVYGLRQAENGADVAFENGAFVATYELAKNEAVTGVINYVDLDGKIVRTVDMGPIPVEGIDKPFDRAFVEDDVYYRAINNLTGNMVHLTTLQPTKQIRVMAVSNADAGTFGVTVEYWASEDLDEGGNPKAGKEGNALWTDDVVVKGAGYQYTLPNTFSTAKKSGIEFYTLTGVAPETATGRALAETEQMSPVIQLNSAIRNVLSKQDRNTSDDIEWYTLRAIYDSQETTKEVTLTIYEYNGETGQVIGDPRGTKLTVKEGQPATYTPSAKTVNGQTLVPWSGNMEPITYEWADLQKGTDLVQRVYYVPEGYTPGDAYDITVQYMNIATSQVLRTQTITVDPEANQFVNILGEERFVEGGNEYVRLNGQETAIRHAYFTPTRTYTIYYRDVNDELSSQITVQRTQIIDTERVVTVPGTTVITAAPAAVAADGGDDGAAAPAGAAPAGAAAPVVDAGVGAGDGTTIINDDDNPLANLDGTTTTQERIEDDATALSSGIQDGINGVNAMASTAAIIGVAALLGVAVLLVLRRRRKNAAGNGSVNQ